MRQVNVESDIAYIKDMLLYLEKAKEVVPKANRFGIPLDDDMVISSIAMNLGQVGEQLSQGKLSDNVKEEFSDRINWSEIKGFRNFIYHNYGNLKFHLIKKILDESVPRTEESLLQILRMLESRLEDRK